MSSYGLSFTFNWNMSKEELLPLISSAIDFLYEVKGDTIRVERSRVWSNEKQKHLDEYQYQVFTRNSSCAPAQSIEGAYRNAATQLGVMKNVNP